MEAAIRPNPGAQSRFLRAPEKYPALIMGLGGGKTWAGAAKLILLHCAYPGTDSLGVEPTFPNIRQIMLPAITSQLAKLGVTYRVNLFENAIYTPQLGSKILLHSAMSAERITGFTVGRAWIDEAARTPDMTDPQRNVWYNTNARVRDARVPPSMRQVFITGTHEGAGTWVYRLWERPHDTAKKYAVYRGSTRENPEQHAYADELVQIYGEELAAQYVEGRAVDSDMSLLSWQQLLDATSDRATSLVEWDRLAKSTFPLFCGVDVGRKKSLTVLWIASLQGDTLVTEAVIEMREVGFREQSAVITRAASLPKMMRISIDATYNPQTAEMAVEDHGQHVIDPVIYTARIKVELAQALANELQQGKMLLPSGEDILMDFFSIKRVVTKSGVVTYKAPFNDDGHADRFQAAALCVRAASLGDGAFEYVGGGDRRTRGFRGLI